MHIEFCLPVYNEEKIIKNNAERLIDYCLRKNFGFDWKIILINNGSTDRTSQICDSLKSERIDACFIEKAGKGGALKEYWKISKADIIAYMDIDLAVSLHNIPALLAPLLDETYDLVIGSRLMADSKIKRSLIREVNSQTYNLFSKVLLGHHFSDSQCGFKAFRRDVIGKVSPYIRDDRWFFDTELIVFADHFGFRIKEIPVDWEENRYDQRKSKTSLLRDGFAFMMNLVKLKFRMSKLIRQNQVKW
jgi:glycosyltransferase involved in cell wall biosynthesis